MLLFIDSLMHRSWVWSDFKLQFTFLEGMILWGNVFSMHVTLIYLFIFWCFMWILCAYQVSIFRHIALWIICKCNNRWISEETVSLCPVLNTQTWKTSVYVVNFVVLCGSHVSRKSRAMSHSSSVGEKEVKKKKKNVAVDCGCRWTGLFICDNLHPVPQSSRPQQHW